MKPGFRADGEDQNVMEAWSGEERLPADSPVGIFCRRIT